MVVAYFDMHQPISQDAVVEHFANLEDGALIFTQASLSRHLSKKGREADLAKLQSHPGALDSKRVRSVTRPDVEQCLVFFVRHWEDFRGRPVSGPMLAAKRQFFEERLNVPEAERMKSTGWILGFCKTYVMLILIYIQLSDKNCNLDMACERCVSMAKQAPLMLLPLRKKDSGCQKFLLNTPSKIDGTLMNQGCLDCMSFVKI